MPSICNYYIGLIIIKMDNNNDNAKTSIKWNDDIKIHTIKQDDYFIIREEKQPEKIIKIKKIIINIKNNNIIKFCKKNDCDLNNCYIKLLVNFNDIYVQKIILNFNNDITHIELNTNLLVSFESKLFYEIELKKNKNENNIANDDSLYSTEFFDVEDIDELGICKTFDWFNHTIILISYNVIK